MGNETELNRFLTAQEKDYSTALAEMRRGKKQSHWMWYIFPQIRGLGHSSMARHYAIHDLAEATDYLAHPVLGPRLVEISRVLLSLPGNNALAVMGSPDDLKLRSCMTLFSLVAGADAVFLQVLTKFYDSKPDEQTIEIARRLNVG
jgi:uncharacterized protein (DUF1810 family)